MKKLYKYLIVFLIALTSLTTISLAYASKATQSNDTHSFKLPSIKTQNYTMSFQLFRW